MNAFLAAVIFIPLSLLIFYVPFYFTRGFRKHRLSKFIPSLLCAVVISVFAVKFLFFQSGFSGILDVIVMGYFAVLFLIYTGLALLHTSLFQKNQR